jgi:hypothetical protein
MLLIQRAGLGEDCVGDGHLSDVVQLGSFADMEEIIRGQHHSLANRSRERRGSSWPCSSGPLTLRSWAEWLLSMIEEFLDAPMPGAE